MSYNQSRSDKNDTTQYRKSDRRSASSNQQRGSSGAYVKGGGPAPSPSYVLSSGRSLKRNNNNAQGGQSRASVPTVNSSSLESSNVSALRSAAVQNGSHVLPQFHGASDMPVTSPAAKPAESSAPQRSNRTVPKVPTSQPASMSSDSTAPRTPIKAPGDASKAFSFQFGCISPGFMNGMQVPARTSSAPLNLEEQKRDQARHDCFRSAAPLPTPSASKQQLPRKDADAVNQPNTGEAYPVSKAKKDAQVSPAPPASQQKPPGLPITGMSMPMPFHQSQVSVQYGGLNQQLQSQGMTAAASLQMPLHMPLAMGNPPQVQPPVFVQGLQPHPMQTQGIIHQSHGLSFTTQMGPQLPPQLSSMGITMSPQYSQQQGGKFGVPRKTTVKITHPDIHEELRLDKRADSYSDGGSSGPRSHPNVPPQSQPIPSYGPSHTMSFYTPNSLNASPMYYPPQSSVPLTSSQMAPSSQAPRFNYQVGQGPQNMTFMNHALSSLPVNKTGTQMHGVADLPNLEHSRDLHTIISSAPSTTIPVTVKPSAGSIGEKVADSMRPNSSHGAEKGESPKHVRPSGEASSSHPERDSEICSESSLQQSKHDTESLVSKSLPVATNQSAVSAVISSEGLVSNPLSSALVSPSEESTVVVPNNEGRRREILGRSNSIKDHQKKTGKKGHVQSQRQVSSQSTSTSNLHSRALEHGISSSSGLSGAVEAKPALATPTSSESVSLSRPSLLTVGGATDASELKVESVGEGSTSVSSEISGSGIIVDSFETAHLAKLDESSLQNEELLHETVSKDEQGESRLPELEFKQDVQSSEISSEPVSLKSSELIKHTEGKQSGQDSDLKAMTTSDEVPTLETSQRGLAEPVECHAEMDGTTDFSDAGSSNGEKASTLDVPSRSDSIGSKEVVTMSGISDQQSAILTPDLLEATSKHEGEIAENFGGSLVSFAASVSKDKPSLDLSKAKNSAKGGKKKMKEILQKADAAGTTSDLYNAYKGLDEKNETAVSTESTESTSNIVDVKQPADAVEVYSIASEMGGTSKAELDDWEDAADISTPKLEVSDNGQQVIGRLDNHDKDEEVVTAKKSSRDFLLKFTEQYLVLPKGFVITSETETLMSANFNISHLVERDSYPSPGRIIDRPSGGSQIERRGSGVVEEDRWSKLSGNFSSGRDPRQVDEEQAKLRQIRAILNKLTPTNFDKLIEQVKAINIDNAATLISFVSQIFDRALMEPIYCEMYVNFCSHLAGKLPERVLLNKCQEVFERGEREQEEANKAEEEGEIKQSAVQREEKRVKARRRMLGNIRLIGELYKKKMLIERIMHACLHKLLGQYQDPDEEVVEALCKLMSTIGEMIDHEKAKERMDRYFERMKTLSNNMNLSSRVRFMLMDAIDLRKNKWQQRRKVEGPKKIEEVHRDAAQEQQAQVSGLGHASSISQSARRAPMDFGSRGSTTLSSPNAQMDGYRGVPPTQDVRSEEILSYEAGNLELMIKDLTLTNRLLLRKLKQWQWWFLVALNIFFLAVGQSAVVLIGRFYYVQGGNGKWMATLVQTAGFPILFIPLFLTPSQQPSTSLALPSIKIHALIYFSLGVLISGDNMMYSVGLLYLPASTYSLICVSQLAFNAVFSYFINSQKFTASIVNSLVVLSLSAALIAVNEDSEGPSGVSRWKYITCLLCTLGASALSSLLLSLMQLSFQKVLKRETFSVVLEMQIYTSLVATCVSIVGLFASGEWKSLHGEMEGFGAGRVSYVMTLVWTAVAWQICSVGVVGLIFMVSSLFSNVISTSSLAVTPIATMIVFHDKMNGVKVIAILLAIWGFASYNYQNYIYDSETSRTQKARRKQKDVSTTNIQQKGSIPSPQTPLLMMHKAEKKYEVGKVADEEGAKQRPIRAILNKLTPTNFEKLIEQMKAINIDNAATLTSFVSQIFDRALMEPIYCEMYVNFCCHLARELPDFNEDNEKVTFKRVLLNKCQAEFERGEREQEEANKAEEEGEIKQSAEQREEKRVKARRRMLGNIRLIGELYKKKVLTERIMHACIQKLLGQYQDPDEEDVEALCKLMSTTGEMIDHQKAKEHMDAYFDRMKALSNNMNLSSRVRFMLKDANDLRKNKWQQRRKVEGPNFISEVHTDASTTTSGPQGGLNWRGPPAISSAAVADTPSKTLH